MEPDDDAELEGPEFRPPPPPDDRVWRHPSEIAAGGDYDPWAPPASPLDQPEPPVAEPGATGSGIRRRRGTRVEHPSGVTLVAPPPPVPTGHTLGIALLAATLASVLTLGLVAATGGIGDRVVEVVEREQVPAVAEATAASLGTDTTSVVAIAEQVRPAITRIEVSIMGAETSGSGVLFRDNGYVLTNSHVVSGADAITVVLSDGTELPGKLIGADEESDVAVVKIDGGPHPVAVLGSATDLRVGETAVAIGSPLGLRGGPSVTVGVISALGRRVESRSGAPLLDMIQTDAPIAPGSSGGALLDRAGAVIGITTAIAVSNVGAEGLGFATPIDVARSVADDLIVDGRVARVWLGIEGLDVTAVEADELEVDRGALVMKVTEDSPAGAAGLRVDDVIVALDDSPIESMSELVVALRRYEPGAEVRITVVRAGARTTVSATLGERPE